MTHPYADEAFTYYRAGWRGVIPLPARAKTPPPSGFTGWTGVETTHEHIGAWVTGPEGGGNVALHLGDGLYGLDVDAYEGKGGAAALAELEAACGPLPPTWKVTSRDDPVSGIRLFRAAMPAGRVWVDQPGGTGRGIEAIHRGHRYVVAWPSVHPKTGAKYRWFLPDGQPSERPPRVDELPELPAAWVIGVSKAGEVRSGSAAGETETIATIDTWPAGKPCYVVQTALGSALAAMARPDVEALHPTANGDIWRLVQLGHEGHVGVREALGQHGARFVAARLESGRGDDDRAAQLEWWRMLRGAVGKVAGDRREFCVCTPPVLAPIEAPPGFTEAVASPAPSSQQAGGRRVDLGPFLDGTYDPPKPCLGADRDDEKVLLYESAWHTLIAPTESGKSLWAAWHAAAELLRGNMVVYAHFEETSPAPTLARLVGMGVPRDVLRDRFVWYDCSTSWQSGELAVHLDNLRGPFMHTAKAAGRPTLLVLDGINEACGQHGWPVDKPEAVTAYKKQFVTPATALGMAVLSLGHPVKDPNRKQERHGFGSTAWLDVVDGVGFRLTPSKDRRIMRGKSGMAILHSVKDRHGQVNSGGLHRESDPEGWFYMGAFCVDDTGSTTRMRLSVPRDDDGNGLDLSDPIDKLGDSIVATLITAPDRGYRGVRALQDMLTAAKVAYDKSHVGPAVQRLQSAGRLEVVAGTRGAVGGRLIDPAPITGDEQA
jgi:hypothetical protein